MSKKIRDFMMVFLSMTMLFSLFNVANILADDSKVMLGDVEIDLSASNIVVEGADSKYIKDFENKDLVFTADYSVTINAMDQECEIYGTKEEPLKDVYNTNIKLQNASVLNVLWNVQKTFELNNYSFINKVPSQLNLPVPFYFERGEQDPTGWMFESRQNEGYTNTVVSINNLQEMIREAVLSGNEYIYKSSPFLYTPIVYYLNDDNVKRESKNASTRVFSTKFGVDYTVDISPITDGGTPLLAQLEEVNVADIHNNNNADFFRNGDINSTVVNEYVQPQKATDSGMGKYGTDYVINTNARRGYEVDYVIVKTYDPITGELSATKTYEANEVEEIESIIKGQTEIQVAYKRTTKVLDFIKVDENKNPIITGEAEFSVYDDKECQNIIGKSSYDQKTGAVTLPALYMPLDDAEYVNYYMKETNPPLGYEANDTIYTITIYNDGRSTIEGNKFEDNYLINEKIKDPTIEKEGSLPTHVKKGDTITYTLTVSNPYEANREIIVSDHLAHQLKATKYYVDGELQEDEWTGNWSGIIKAKSELTFEIEAEVIESYDNNDLENNVILNIASLRSKDLITNEYGEEEFTKIVKHYLYPSYSYEMNKTRITQPDNGLKGFYAGTDQIIEYEVELKNTGEIPLTINLIDVFEQEAYFEFIESNKTQVTLGIDEEAKIVFKAKIKKGTPENYEIGYKNTVTAEATGEYVDPDSNERIVINKTNWEEAVKTSDAYTPIVEKAKEETKEETTKPIVPSGDKTMLSFYVILLCMSSIILLLKLKKSYIK